MIAARPADELLHAAPTGRAVEDDDRGKGAAPSRLAQGRCEVHAVLRFDVGLLNRRLDFAHDSDVLIVRKRVALPGEWTASACATGETRAANAGRLRNDRGRGLAGGRGER